MDLHNIREDYKKNELSLTSCKDNPIEQLELWVNDAVNYNIKDPTAMNIATIFDNKPSSRIVLLKEINDKGLVFFTNYSSRKGKNLSSNPYIAVNFFWSILERQVRVEGEVVRLANKESDDYFNSRPYLSKIGAWSSKQSQILDNKINLLKRVTKYSLKYKLDVPRPEFWGGYLIIPNYFEFWQGRPSRLHDRICYKKEQDIWNKFMLYP